MKFIFLINCSSSFYNGPYKKLKPSAKLSAQNPRNEGHADEMKCFGFARMRYISPEDKRGA